MRGYWQPQPLPAVAAGAQHLALSLASQHVVCRSVLQHAGAADCRDASMRSAAEDWNSFGWVMVTPGFVGMGTRTDGGEQERTHRKSPWMLLYPAERDRRIIRTAIAPAHRPRRRRP